MRFKRRDALGPFVDAIVDPNNRPDLQSLVSDYDAAFAAHNPANGQDTIRVIERSFDADNNQLTEAAVSKRYGTVMTEWRYDRFNNKTREISAKGLHDSLGNSIENPMAYTYDAYDRVVTTRAGSAVITLTYDRAGNKSTETDPRGYTKRFFYDLNNRLNREWDAAEGMADGTLGPSSLRTDYVHDNLGRVIEKDETDLTGLAGQPVHKSFYNYNNYDELVHFTDAAGGMMAWQYDASGNMIAETNANGFAVTTSDERWALNVRFRLGIQRILGTVVIFRKTITIMRPAFAAELTEAEKQSLTARYTERYQYDAENRVTRRTDRDGQVWRTAYNAYGRTLSETDPNGRVTQYTIGAYGQVLQKSIRVPSVVITTIEQPYQIIEGARSYTETTRYDWLDHTAEIKDDFGKYIVNHYDDGDRLVRIDDRTTHQITDYVYDPRGLRIRETLTQDGTLIRTQTQAYNERGWLTNVTSGFNYRFAGAQLGQDVAVNYTYDLVGNRVAVSGHAYTYDGNNRMVSAFDTKTGSPSPLSSTTALATG